MGLSVQTIPVSFRWFVTVYVFAHCASAGLIFEEDVTRGPNVRLSVALVVSVATKTCLGFILTVIPI